MSKTKEGLVAAGTFHHSSFRLRPYIAYGRLQIIGLPHEWGWSPGCQTLNQHPAKPAAAVENWHPGNVTNRRNTSGTVGPVFTFKIHTLALTHTQVVMARQVNEHRLLRMLDGSVFEKIPAYYHPPSVLTSQSAGLENISLLTSHLMLLAVFYIWVKTLLASFTRDMSIRLKLCSPIPINQVHVWKVSGSDAIKQRQTPLSKQTCTINLYINPEYKRTLFLWSRRQSISSAPAPLRSWNQKLQRQSKCLQSRLSQHTVSYHILCLYAHMLQYTHTAVPMTGMRGKSRRKALFERDSQALALLDW